MSKNKNYGKILTIGVAIAGALFGVSKVGNDENATAEKAQTEISVADSHSSHDNTDISVQSRQSQHNDTQKNIEIPLSKSAVAEQILHRKAYTVSYNKELRVPNWVAWHLTRKHTKGENTREEQFFTDDLDVPSPRATEDDYRHSGYSRGHMCPSADNRWDGKAQSESFLYTNCCPQNYDLNAGDWGALESRCRHWANVYGDVYIVCGPLFKGKNHKTIGKNRVAVPEAFFKVVLRMGKKPAAIGFVYSNEGTSRAMVTYMNTIDEVERLTGFDFFSALEDNLENDIEAKADLNDWK